MSEVNNSFMVSSSNHCCMGMQKQSFCTPRDTPSTFHLKPNTFNLIGEDKGNDEKTSAVVGIGGNCCSAVDSFPLVTDLS